ncbi:MAG: type I restriction endonuclease subunit R [Nanoarchaeota archaeon]
MTLLTEQDIENVTLEMLQELGYEVVHGPDITPDSENPKRKRWDDVILEDDLRQAIEKLNPKLPDEAVEEAIKKVRRLNSKTTIKNNEQFHTFLIEGIPLEYRAKNGKITSDYIKIIDFKNPKNNNFKAVNQFAIIENNKHRRPDVIIFINGLPLIIAELKNSSSETADLTSAYKQLQTYKQEIPTIFNYNEILIVSDGTYAEAGTLTATKEWFLPWKTVDGKETASKTMPQIQVMIEGMFQKQILLDIIKNFISFSKNKKQTVKLLAGYHQYHAANKAISTTIKAIDKSKKAGIIWHTQGSGKSLTLAFYAGKIQVEPTLNNPTLVILTDRNDLDDQLFQTFSNVSCLREKPKQANSKEELKQLLKRSSGGIIFTTIQKFAEDNQPLSTRSNIIIAADEAHRSQYGFKAKIDKDTGETKYGFAKYIRDALPNASFIGFTGTPIDFEDKSTRAVFGNYIDVYDIEQSVDDGRTVKIYYESRLAELKLNQYAIKDIDEDFEEVTEGEENKQQLKTKWAQLEKIVGSETRINLIAKDIVEHFEKRLDTIEGKAMIVCMSRRICIDLHNAIKKIRPKWHNKDDDKGFMKVVMTGSASDGPEWQEHIRDKRRRKALGEHFKDSESEFKLAIVRDMWLTGFDVPSLHTLYIDKPMKGHGLMQAIARANRVYKDKQGGLIVDYLGIAQELKKALSNYTESGGKGKPTVNQDEAIAILKEKHEVVSQMFYGFNYKKFFTANARERMNIISGAMEHILKQPDGKKRYIREVTALTKAFSLSVPSKESEKLRDEVGFFQAIKASILKNTESSGVKKSKEDMDSAIKQIVSKALSSEGVIDVFEVAGMDKPEISILSDKFLDDVKGMTHKNLAFEALKKLLADQIKARFKQNKIKNKKFSEMLEEVIKKYQNRSITSAQVVQELVEIAKQVRDDKQRGKELGLTKDEEAFYDALANNESAVEELGDEILKKISRELTELVRKNTSIDWTIRKNVQSKLKVMIKRLLRKYGYPPDKQKVATDMVLEQAKGFAQDWAEDAKISNDFTNGLPEMAVADNKKEKYDK